jgi:hypothetical protein
VSFIDRHVRGGRPQREIVMDVQRGKITLNSVSSTSSRICRRLCGRAVIGRPMPNNLRQLRLPGAAS